MSSKRPATPNDVVILNSVTDALKLAILLAQDGKVVQLQFDTEQAARDAFDSVRSTPIPATMPRAWGNEDSWDVRFGSGPGRIEFYVREHVSVDGVEMRVKF